MTVTCAECQDLLLDLAYGELDGARAAGVEAHLVACAACRSERAQIAGIRSLMAPLLVAEEPRAAIDEVILKAARAEAQRLAAGSDAGAGAGTGAGRRAAARPRVVEVVGTIGAPSAAAPVDVRAQVQTKPAEEKPSRRRWAMRLAISGSLAAAAGLALVVTDSGKMTAARDERLAVQQAQQREIRIRVPGEKASPAGAKGAAAPAPTVERGAADEKAQLEARLAELKSRDAKLRFEESRKAAPKSEPARLVVTPKAKMEAAPERAAKGGALPVTAGSPPAASPAPASAAPPPPAALAKRDGEPASRGARDSLEQAAPPSPAAESQPQEAQQNVQPSAKSALDQPAYDQPAYGLPAERPAERKAKKSALAQNRAMGALGANQGSGLPARQQSIGVLGGGPGRAQTGAATAALLEAQARSARHGGNYLAAARLYRQAAVAHRQTAAAGGQPMPTSNQAPADLPMDGTSLRKDLGPSDKGPARETPAEALMAAAWALAHAVECLAADARIDDARRIYEELLDTYPQAQGPQLAAARALRMPMTRPATRAAPRGDQALPAADQPPPPEAASPSQPR